MQRKNTIYYAVTFFFLAALVLNVGFWLHARKILPQWDNVLPAPNPLVASMSGLGDPEIAYRLVGYFLQNTGNVGGNFAPLKSYDYATLEEWFFLSQVLDERANYVPFMASYYFGAVEDEPERISHVVKYLSEQGQLPYPQKWRWLTESIFLTRFKMKDMDEALRQANILASLDTDTPPWARQMPAFIQLKMGNKEAAYNIMLNMLKTEGSKLPAGEIKEMRHYICTRTLEPGEAAKNPLCQDKP